MLLTRVVIAAYLCVWAATCTSVYYLSWRIGSVTATEAVFGALSSCAVPVVGAWVWLRRVSAGRWERLTYHEKQLLIVVIAIWGLIHAWLWLSGQIHGMQRWLLLTSITGRR